jgi:TonB family protein
MERVTLEQFRQQNPQRTTPTPRPTARPQVEIPRIQTEEIRRNLDTLINSESDRIRASRLSLSEQDALNRYFGALRARVDLNWQQPRDLAGRNLTATAVFTVNANGEITRLRFEPASGNARFDQTIREAFTRAGSHGRTPDGMSHELRLPFRMSTAN